jgi:hypothetical protein
LIDSIRFDSIHPTSSQKNSSAHYFANWTTMKTSQAFQLFVVCAALASANAFAIKPTNLQSKTTSMVSSNEKEEEPFKVQYGW